MSIELTLQQVNWNQRLSSLKLYSCYASIDCTDVKIAEPWSFSHSWYSYKHNGAGLRYELAISLSGQIVWANGPYKCKIHPDVMIIRDKLKLFLLPGENVISDRGYPDERCVSPNNSSLEGNELAALIRARHETANRRLKQFNVLRSTFRHQISKHSICFFAVVNTTALQLQQNHLFTI